MERSGNEDCIVVELENGKAQEAFKRESFRGVMRYTHEVASEEVAKVDSPQLRGESNLTGVARVDRHRSAAQWLSDYLLNRGYSGTSEFRSGLRQDSGGAFQDFYPIAQDIRHHNDRILRKISREEIGVSDVTKVIIYPMGGNKGKKMLVEVDRTKWEGKPWPEDLRLGQWFPRGAHAAREYMPFEASLDDAYGYDFYILMGEEDPTAHYNIALDTQFGFHWKGNVIVLKFSNRDRLAVRTVVKGDVHIVNGVLGCWLDRTMPERVEPIPEDEDPRGPF
ncbi:hypothetical protein K474DRAFT_1679299 [Panus rudis PR-1116 ss-1]|nr:hypothetical protein K474DRAFT_1679299 [Panus rudis PR-1116 ss-1]